MSVALKDKIQPIIMMLESRYGLGDFRTSLIGKPVSAIILQILIFKSNQYTFYNNDWWESIGVPVEGRKRFAERHDAFVKYLGFIHFFSTVEAQFRVLVAELKLAKNRRGFIPFKGIYDMVFAELDFIEYMELFDFARLIRNAIHNNGFYVPSNAKDRSIVFRSEKYFFMCGKEIDFFYPTLSVSIEEDIFDCLSAIVKHSRIGSIRHSVR